MTGGFNVMKAAIRRTLKGVLKVALGLGVDVFRRQIAPALLKTHSPKRQNRRYGVFGLCISALQLLHCGVRLANIVTMTTSPG